MSRQRSYQIPPTRSLAEFLEDDGKQTPSKKKGVPYCTKDRLIQMGRLSNYSKFCSKKSWFSAKNPAENLYRNLPFLTLNWDCELAGGKSIHLQIVVFAPEWLRSGSGRLRASTWYPLCFTRGTNVGRCFRSLVNLGEPDRNLMASRQMKWIHLRSVVQDGQCKGILKTMKKTYIGVS